jgi:hypothetical protein
MKARRVFHMGAIGDTQLLAFVWVGADHRYCFTRRAVAGAIVGLLTVIAVMIVREG